MPTIVSFALIFAGHLTNKSFAENVDVYILTGQSNSLGTTGLEVDPDPPVHAGDAATDFFWSNVLSSNSVYPPNLYGDSGGAITSLQMQQGDGGSNSTFWGPEFGFARSMFDVGQNNVLVIKASRGGGGNGYWDKDTFDSNANNGHMWGHVRDTVDAALTTVVNQGDTFEVKGLMYLQGESNNGTEASLAGTRLAELIDNLQLHIDTDYPDTADNMHTAVGEIAASQANANRQTTTQQQMDLAASDPDITFVGTSDLPLKSDNIHFGRDAKLTIGERFADVFIGQLEQPNGIAGDVNQNGSVFGDGSGPAETDDVTAFIDGWLSETSGMTNLEKTLAGDLNFSGKTTLADAYILHGALVIEGGAFPFELLNAVPEPGCMVLLGIGTILLAGRQRWANGAR